MKKYKSIIPKNAIEKIHIKQNKKIFNSDEEIGIKEAYYYLNGKKIGYRSWMDGNLEMEYLLKNGKYHGPFIRFHDNGQILEQTYYENGHEHGINRQFDFNGNLKGSYKMNHGTGSDYWFEKKAVLSEERYYVKSLRHGFERWWNGKKKVFEESHFNMGKEHGIFRRWNDNDRMSRKYPQYYINGRKVTKITYIKESLKDSSLPKFLEKENKPFRKHPEIKTIN